MRKHFTKIYSKKEEEKNVFFILHSMRRKYFYRLIIENDIRMKSNFNSIQLIRISIQFHRIEWNESMIGTVWKKKQQQKRKRNKNFLKKRNTFWIEFFQNRNFIKMMKMKNAEIFLITKKTKSIFEKLFK